MQLSKSATIALFLAHKSAAQSTANTIQCIDTNQSIKLENPNPTQQSSASYFSNLTGDQLMLKLYENGDDMDGQQPNGQNYCMADDNSDDAQHGNNVCRMKTVKTSTFEIFQTYTFECLKPNGKSRSENCNETKVVDPDNSMQWTQYSCNSDTFFGNSGISDAIIEERFGAAGIARRIAAAEFNISYDVARAEGIKDAYKAAELASFQSSVGATKAAALSEAATKAGEDKTKALADQATQAAEYKTKKLEDAAAQAPKDLATALGEAATQATKEKTEAVEAAKALANGNEATRAETAKGLADASEADAVKDAKRVAAEEEAAAVKDANRIAAEEEAKRVAATVVLVVEFNRGNAGYPCLAKERGCNSSDLCCGTATSTGEGDAIEDTCGDGMGAEPGAGYKSMQFAGDYTHICAAMKLIGTAGSVLTAAYLM